MPKNRFMISNLNETRPSRLRLLANKHEIKPMDKLKLKILFCQINPKLSRTKLINNQVAR